MKQILAIGCLAILVACSDGNADTALGQPVIDTLPTGVVRVTNTSPTAWSDTNGWKILPTVEIKPAEGSAGELANIVEVVGDDHGNTYVLQRGPAVIKVFGPDGQWVRDIGREGDGPGEFRSGMMGIRGDTLVIQDPNNIRFSTFLTDGTFIGSAQSQCCWWTSNFAVLGNGLAIVMGPPPNGADSTANGGYYFTRMDGTVADTVIIPGRGSPNDQDEGLWQITRRIGNGTSMMNMNIPGRPFETMGFLQDGRFVRSHSGNYQVAIGDLYADTTLMFTGVAPQLNLTQAERDSMFAVAVEQIDEDWREAVREIARPEQIPTTRPLTSGFAVDHDSHIWVGLPGAGTSLAALDVFTSEGVLLGRVRAPDDNLLNGYWTRDRIYVRDEDEMGFPMIRIFRIVRDLAGNRE